MSILLFESLDSIASIGESRLIILSNIFYFQPGDLNLFSMYGNFHYLGLSVFMLYVVLCFSPKITYSINNWFPSYRQLTLLVIWQDYPSGAAELRNCRSIFLRSSTINPVFGR